MDVTIDNVGEYVQRVLDVLLSEGVRAQVASFRSGFSSVRGPLVRAAWPELRGPASHPPPECHRPPCTHRALLVPADACSPLAHEQVFPVDKLGAFSAEELDVLLNGSREQWQVSVIIEHLKFDHGYTRSSRAVGFLLEVICEFNDATLATFLKFVTGSPRLPVGGLARLTPRLTIVQKRPEDGVSPDAYLPSVMTCANYVKLPDYSSKEIMRERIMTAISEGQGAFYLS